MRPSTLRNAAKATIRRVIGGAEAAPRDSQQESAKSEARVYPFPMVVRQQDAEFPQTPFEVAARLAALETEISGLKDMLVEVRKSRDEWREHVIRLTGALPSLSSRPWWRRLAG
jgi:hypothetical protein